MLHGDIKVNDVVIGTWEACNTQTHDADGLVIYEVRVDYRNLMGYPMVAEFETTHDAGYGALTLVGKILTETTQYLRYK